MSPNSDLDILLRELIDVEDTAVPAFINEHRQQLLAPAAVDRLAQLAQSAPGPRVQQRIDQRLQTLLQWHQRQAFTELPPEEQLYTLFRQTEDSLALQNLVLQVRDADLDMLDDVVAQRRAAADADERAEIDERHAMLRQIRAQLREQYGDHLPFVKRLNAWMQTNSWQESHDYLRRHKSEMLSRPSQRAMQMLVDADPENPVLLEHQQILRDGERHGVVRAYARRAEREAAAAPDPAREQALSRLLLTWMQQETLAAAEAYLAAHADALLSDDGEAVMRQIVLANAGNPGVRDHYRRLRAAREMGVTAVYAAVRRQRLEASVADLARRGPVAAAVAHFLQLPEEESEAYLAQTAALHTEEAGTLLAQLAEAAAAVESAPADRVAARHAQWQQREGA